MKTVDIKTLHGSVRRKVIINSMSVKHITCVLRKVAHYTCTLKQFLNVAKKQFEQCIRRHNAQDFYVKKLKLSNF